MVDGGTATSAATPPLVVPEPPAVPVLVIVAGSVRVGNAWHVHRAGQSVFVMQVVAVGAQ